MTNDAASISPPPAGNAGGPRRVLGAAQTGDGGWLLSGLWWMVVGAAISFGIVALLTIGWVFLAVGVVLAVVGTAIPWVRNRAAHMGLVGFSAAPLTLAWLNRDGPGTVCQVSGSETTCVDQWSPWPFVAVAAILVAAGLLLEGHRRRTGALMKRG